MRRRQRKTDARKRHCTKCDSCDKSLLGKVNLASDGYDIEVQINSRHRLDRRQRPFALRWRQLVTVVICVAVHTCHASRIFSACAPQIFIINETICWCIRVVHTSSLSHQYMYPRPLMYYRLAFQTKGKSYPKRQIPGACGMLCDGGKEVGVYANAEACEPSR